MLVLKSCYTFYHFILELHLILGLALTSFEVNENLKSRMSRADLIVMWPVIVNVIVSQYAVFDFSLCVILALIEF